MSFREEERMKTLVKKSCHSWPTSSTSKVNYQRKPAREGPKRPDRQGSLSTGRHPRDLGYCRHLPPGAQTASNRFSCLRQLIEPRSSLTTLRVLEKRSSNEVDRGQNKEERKRTKHKYAMQINNETLQTVESEDKNGE